MTRVAKKGMISFRSDSVSTIAVVREIISEETTNRQIKVQISCDLNDASINYCLKQLHPRMTHLLNLEKRKLMAAALKELEANSSDISFLSEQNKKILENHDQIFQDAEKDSMEVQERLSSCHNLKFFRQQITSVNFVFPPMLCASSSTSENCKVMFPLKRKGVACDWAEFVESNVCGIYEALLLNRARLNGQNARGKVEGLRELLLNNYSLENVTAFFKTANEEASLRY
ncbi:unnamed protein product [Cylicostephanus goldi]|uniref:Uncharacterized protein n=1 Tax=Cylicostephanus goldi TaxID=71465 RepID=A0A3P7N7D2_CYLGO|nr:unnamed protein product [Cylicostephanus goldi]